MDLTFGQLTKHVSANQTKYIPLPLHQWHLFFFLFALEYKDNGVKFFLCASGRLRTAQPTCWNLGWSSWSRCCFCKGLHAHEQEHLVIDVGTLVGCIVLTEVTCPTEGEQCGADQKVDFIISFLLYSFKI